MENNVVGSVALLGESSGVHVVRTDAGFEVGFEYDRELSAMLVQVAGAMFDKEASVFKVPLASEGHLTGVVAAMRNEVELLASELDVIHFLATTTALQLQHETGAEPDVVPQVSSYIEPGKVYRGAIVNANTRFVAQETGFGKQDGAAFIQIHRLANLPNAGLFKGDLVAVTYDEKFMGQAQPFTRSKPMDVLAAEFDTQIGQVIDGVVATDRGDKIGIGFDFNAHMASRIRRLDGATFNKEDKVWEVPKAVQPFALHAIEDLRNMYVLDSIDVDKLKAVAEAKIDNPKIYQADVRNGASHFGVILEVGERFALQSSGRGNFNLHHLAFLDQVPMKGHDVNVSYKDGKGAVRDKQLERGTGVGR